MLLHRRGCPWLGVAFAACSLWPPAGDGSTGPGRRRPAAPRRRPGNGAWPDEAVRVRSRRDSAASSKISRSRGSRAASASRTRPSGRIIPGPGGFWLSVQPVLQPVPASLRPLLIRDHPPGRPVKPRPGRPHPQAAPQAAATRPETPPRRHHRHRQETPAASGDTRRCRPRAPGTVPRNIAAVPNPLPVTPPPTRSRLSPVTCPDNQQAFGHLPKLSDRASLTRPPVERH